MNIDILQGKWMQLRGQAKQRWGKLTDSDLDKVTGKADELAGLLKEKYGYTTEKAHQEIASFLRYALRFPPPPVWRPNRWVCAAEPTTTAKPAVETTKKA